MSDDTLLVIEDLHVSIGDREILRGVDLVIERGKTHVLLGANGGGKTTLLNTIIGLPDYRVTRGRIVFKGTDLAGLAIDERARLGIGVAYQRPPAVRGIRLRQLIEVAAGEGAESGLADSLTAELDLGQMIDRDVNMGFSGGEAKRSEMAQLLAQAPDLALFDEPESGVDLENVAVVGSAMQHLLKGEKACDPHRSGLIITHTGHILQYVHADVGHVLHEGRLACAGNPLDLVNEIAANGFDKCVECAACRR